MHAKLSLVVAFGLSLFLATTVDAQRKVEVFAGYQYARPDGGPNLNGWNGAATKYFSRHFGLTADLSGTYSSGGSMYVYTFGPQISKDVSAFRPFAHALFGGVSLVGCESCTTGFGAMAGGGFDLVDREESIAWRVVQADWLITRFSGCTDRKNVRISTGLVFDF
jgi:hypothetical protein